MYQVFLQHDINNTKLKVIKTYNKFFSFLGLHPWHMEVPRLGDETAIAAGLCRSHSNTGSKLCL